MPRTLAKKKKKSLYSVHPGVAMVQDWIDKLPEKTGRSLDEWIELVQKSGPQKEKERREWLKTEHKMGTNGAWWIAERAAIPSACICSDQAHHANPHRSRLCPGQHENSQTPHRHGRICQERPHHS